MKLSDWLWILEPLIQLIEAVAWPATVILLAIWIREPCLRFLKAIAERVEKGEAVEASTTGVKLGPRQNSPSDPEAITPVKDDALPHSIYIVHRARRDAALDKGSLEYRRLRIWIDGDDPALLDDVRSVTYHLHPTFNDPVRTVTDRESSFAIATAAWGEFNMYAEIEFSNGQKPIKVERYINFA